MGVSINWEKIWQEEIEADSAEAEAEADEHVQTETDMSNAKSEKDEESSEEERRERGYKALEMIYSQKVIREAEQNLQMRRKQRCGYRRDCGTAARQAGESQRCDGIAE